MPAISPTTSVPGHEGRAHSDEDLWRRVQAEEIELYVTEQVSNSYDQTPHGGRLRGDEEGDFLFAVPSSIGP